MLAPDSRPRVREKILKERASGTTILFDVEEGQYYALDEVGARVWELCDGSRSVAEVITLLCQEYDAPVDTIEADVQELLGDLANEKLVVTGA